MLAIGLGECKALAHLDLSRNGIGDEGAGILGEVLRDSKTLAHLDLSSNDIGDEGAGIMIMAGDWTGGVQGAGSP